MPVQPKASLEQLLHHLGFANSTVEEHHLDEGFRSEQIIRRSQFGIRHSIYACPTESLARTVAPSPRFCQLNRRRTPLGRRIPIGTDNSSFAIWNSTFDLCLSNRKPRSNSCSITSVLPTQPSKNTTWTKDSDRNR